ncbi:MAG: hypothetical protein II183_00610, partial [Elusimicrobiaceae bacterium]|nr:hypothetical protein [Elusimicrobiaceae bacterium]
GCYFSNCSESLCEVKCTTDKNIYNVVVYFNSTKIERYCFAKTTNLHDIANQVCQKETQKTTANWGCSSYYCSYTYR